MAYLQKLLVSMREADAKVSELENELVVARARQTMLFDKIFLHSSEFFRLKCFSLNSSD